MNTDYRKIAYELWNNHWLDKDSIDDAAKLIEEMSSPKWQPIETAPKGKEVWAFNGEQGRMKWVKGNGFALWIWADETLMDIDPNPEQPTHWMPLPQPPRSAMKGEGR